jgi:hypothetical protein
MSQKILMEALAKFQRGEPRGFDVSLSPIARGTEQASRFHRIMAVVGVVPEFFRKLAFANGTAIPLRLKRGSNHLWGHASFRKTLVVGSAPPKIWISSVQLILSFPIKFFLRLASRFTPYFGVLNTVISDNRIGVIRSLRLFALLRSTVFGARNTPLFSLFVGYRQARSSTWFRLFHGHDYTMTPREIGVIL